MSNLLHELVPHEKILASGGEARGPITSIEIDSRMVKEGSLFCAIHGSRFDSHSAIESIRGKLSALIIERPLSQIPNLMDLSSMPPWVQVTKVRDVLGPVSHQFFGCPSERCTLIGVTGTNGKTSITSLLAEIGRHAGRSTAAIGTLGIQGADFHEELDHTTPEAPLLQRSIAGLVSRGVEWVPMEVSSHSLALSRVNGCRFQVAIYTNLTLDHLDYHGTMERYFQAKRILFTHFRPATSVINVDDPYGRRLVGECTGNTITYSVDNRAADLFADGLELTDRGVRCRVVSKKWPPINIQSTLIGRHNVSNLLAAVGGALALDTDPAVIEKGISDFQGVPGRLERIDTPKQVAVFVDYAHTPDALERVLQTVGQIARRRLWTVFGCGGDRDRSKRPRMGRIATESSDAVIITNDNPRSEAGEGIAEDILGGIPLETQRHSFDEVVARGGCFVELDRKKAIEMVLTAAEPGDMVMIAGKGHEDYQIIGKEKTHFDDREVVRNWASYQR